VLVECKIGLCEGAKIPCQVNAAPVPSLKPPSHLTHTPHPTPHTPHPIPRTSVVFGPQFHGKVDGKDHEALITEGLEKVQTFGGSGGGGGGGAAPAAGGDAAAPAAAAKVEEKEESEEEDMGFGLFD